MKQVLTPNIDPPSRNTDKRLTAAAATVLVVTLAIHLILDFFYRPWIWASGRSDLHFADAFTNVTSVIIVASLMVLVERQKLWVDRATQSLIVLAPLVGMVCYEFMQPLLPWGTFDTWDIAWTFVGAALVVGIKHTVFDPLVEISTNRPQHEPNE